MIQTIALLIAIYALNLIDYFQTMYAVQTLGIGVEANPIARYLIEHNCGGVPKLIIVPILLTAMGFIVHLDEKQKWAIYVALAMYLYVVISNFVTIFQAGL